MFLYSNMRGLKSKKKRSQKSGVSSMAQVKKFRRNVLSLPQLLSKLRQQRTRPSMSSPSKGQSQISGQRSSTNQRRDAQQKKLQFGSQVNQPFSSLAQQNRKKTVKPIIPPKTLVIILKEKPTKQVYNRRIIDYKHSGLLQRYIGLGGKILPRRQTRLTAKQQRFIAKTIKTARVMGLLPFVSKERGFFK